MASLAAERPGEHQRTASNAARNRRQDRAAIAVANRDAGAERKGRSVCIPWVPRRGPWFSAPRTLRKGSVPYDPLSRRGAQQRILNVVLRAQALDLAVDMAGELRHRQCARPKNGGMKFLDVESRAQSEPHPFPKRHDFSVAQ